MLHFTAIGTNCVDAGFQLIGDAVEDVSMCKKIEEGIGKGKIDINIDGIGGIFFAMGSRVFHFRAPAERLFALEQLLVGGNVRKERYYNGFRITAAL